MWHILEHGKKLKIIPEARRGGSERGDVVNASACERATNTTKHMG